jgi:hypothetical protein
MKTEKIENNANSIEADMFEIWAYVWNVLEEIKNKIKTIIFKN